MGNSYDSIKIFMSHQSIKWYNAIKLRVFSYECGTYKKLLKFIQLLIFEAQC